MPASRLKEEASTVELSYDPLFVVNLTSFTNFHPTTDHKVRWTIYSPLYSGGLLVARVTLTRSNRDIRYSVQLLSSLHFYVLRSPLLIRKKQKHTITEIRWWSPTRLLTIGGISWAERMICPSLYLLTRLTPITTLCHPERDEGGDLYRVIKVKRKNQNHQPINSERYRVRQLTSGRYESLHESSSLACHWLLICW